MTLSGAEATPNSRAFVIRGADASQIHAHRLYQIKTGDVIRKISGGGAGVGNPAARDPEKVRWDVINEFISIEKARDTYRVVIDAGSLAIDVAKTAALRSSRGES